MRARARKGKAASLEGPALVNRVGAIFAMSSQLVLLGTGSLYRVLHWLRALLAAANGAPAWRALAPVITLRRGSLGTARDGSRATAFHRRSGPVPLPARPAGQHRKPAHRRRHGRRARGDAGARVAALRAGALPAGLPPVRRVRAAPYPGGGVRPVEVPAARGPGLRVAARGGRAAARRPGAAGA